MFGLAFVIFLAVIAIVSIKCMRKSMDKELRKVNES
jgi:hypothetical protein